MRRRTFLATSLAGIACYLGWRWWKFRPVPIPQRIRPFITPNEDFFRISIRPGFRPKVDLGQWRLSVRGPSGTTFTLSYDQLLEMETRRVTRTLMCVGNPIGGDGIGNAVWTGTPLGPILERVCNPQHEGLRVVFRAMDGFYSSVPLREALNPETFLVYEMNGVPLPSAHGFPLRVLLPGKYGMKQPRWLQEIEVTSKWVSGYWEKWGWSNECEINMTAQIDSASEMTAGEWQVTGIAFCGREAAGRVEVSDDDGDTWQQAEWQKEPIAGVWRPWKLSWRPRASGENILMVRVVDAKGIEQIDSYSTAYPSGSTGYHQVVVEV